MNSICVEIVYRTKKKYIYEQFENNLGNRLLYSDSCFLPLQGISSLCSRSMSLLSVEVNLDFKKVTSFKKRHISERQNRIHQFFFQILSVQFNDVSNLWDIALPAILLDETFKLFHNNVIEKHKETLVNCTRPFRIPQRTDISRQNYVYI